MSFTHHTHPDALERYAFYWSEARLVIAAVALFLNAYPPLVLILGSLGLENVAWWVLKFAWLISGVSAVYLLYRWLHGGQRLFGHTLAKDSIAFFVLVLSGLNLGIVGLIGQNIGMSIASSYPIFVLVGVVYLAAAYHLYMRWSEAGQKMF